MAAVEENVKPSREESVEASSSDDENSPFNSGEKEEPAKSFKDLVRRVQTNTGSDARLCYEVCVFRPQGVTEVLCEACDQLGWKSPTKIQVEAVPVALQGE